MWKAIRVSCYSHDNQSQTRLYAVVPRVARIRRSRFRKILAVAPRIKIENVPDLSRTFGKILDALFKSGV
jgi:hypothetical protein